VYPNGETYETVNHSLTVKGEGAIKILDVDNKYYYTLKEGTLYTAKIGDVQVVETLGKAPSVNEALALILSKSLYKSHCLRFEGIK
jgi:predicted nucleic-acid-binding Zn-ribbon protein